MWLSVGSWHRFNLFSSIFMSISNMLSQVVIPLDKLSVVDPTLLCILHASWTTWFLTIEAGASSFFTVPCSWNWLKSRSKSLCVYWLVLRSSWKNEEPINRHIKTSIQLLKSPSCRQLLVAYSVIIHIHWSVVNILFFSKKLAFQSWAKFTWNNGFTVEMINYLQKSSLMISTFFRIVHVFLELFGISICNLSWDTLCMVQYFVH